MKKPQKDTDDASPFVDPILEPEPLDELLSETPTPEPPPPLAAPVVANAEPLPAPPPVEKPAEPTPTKLDPPEPSPPPAPMAPPIAPPATPPPPWTPAPSSTPPPLPHFAPVLPTPPPAQPRAEGHHLPDDEWLRIGTMRRGNPELAGLGWALVLIGAAVIALTYYWGITYGNLFAPLGIRGDLIGGVLLVIGLIVAVTFTFVPAEHRSGLGTDASDNDLENLVRYTNGQVLLSQILAGIGLALVMLGILWMAYWLRAGYLDDADLESTFAGINIGTHTLGAPIAMVGFLILFFFLGRLSSARRARNAAVLLWASKRAGAPVSSHGSGMLSNGVSEQQIQDLMKRLDGLMAQLPDAAVTEFSKSHEADTYLKLLGS